MVVVVVVVVVVLVPPSETIPSIPIMLREGLLNNGDGCLTTHLSDIGLFVDGRPVQILEAHRIVGGTNVGNEAPGSTTN